MNPKSIKIGGKYRFFNAEQNSWENDFTLTKVTSTNLGGWYHFLRGDKSQVCFSGRSFDSLIKFRLAERIS